MKHFFLRLTSWSALLGNLFEHYDTSLFGFLAPFLAPLIFPDQNPVTALILTYTMIPLGMLARPIGALLFGYLGDRYGRRHTLFITLAGMGILSGMMALIPTYTQAGLIAPILFCVGRILQNFLAAGESMGGAILLLEQASEDQHDLLSSLYNTTTIGGVLLASAGVFFFSYFGTLEIGWRLLYLFGCITAICGCLLRKQLSIQTLSSSLRQKNTLQLLWTYRKQIALIAIGSGLNYANYTIALIVMNGLVPLISPVTTIEMMSLNTSLLILDLVSLPLFGWMASKISREKLMLISSLCIGFVAIPLFLSLQGASLIHVISIRVCFLLMGVAFAAPFHAWAQHLISPSHRYLILSFSYALGSQILGGPTAAFSLWCFQKTGSAASAAWYWVALSLATGVGLFMARKEKDTQRSSL